MIKVLDHGFVDLVDSMPKICDGLPPSMTRPGDQRIVDAARVSIAGEDVRPTSDDEKLIRYLIKNQHGTPLEKVVFEFDCKMPIFVARQWIRHRIGSFNEMSARYGKLPDDFYIPSIERLLMGGQAKLNKQGSAEAPFGEALAAQFAKSIALHSESSYRLYEGLLGNGVARELARVVLPVNIYTRWFWTVNLRALFNFLGLRLHEHAQWESRQYAEAVLQLAAPLAPYAFKAWRETL
jgi:thymidylate synthase (FAD)